MRAVPAVPIYTYTDTEYVRGDERTYWYVHVHSQRDGAWCSLPVQEGVDEPFQGGEDQHAKGEGEASLSLCILFFILKWNDMQLLCVVWEIFLTKFIKKIINICNIK